jgi:hypothetical protein
MTSTYIYKGQANIEIPPSITSAIVETSVIKKEAFIDCSFLSDIELPEVLREIQDGAFCGCWTLTTMEIPKSVSSLGSHAFCVSGIVTVKLSPNIQIIPKRAFFGCESLQKVESFGITEIHWGAFQNCKSLESLSLSLNLKTVEKIAFYGCHKLKNLAFPQDSLLEDHDIIGACHALLKVEPSKSSLLQKIKYRFHGLPIHAALYYQSDSTLEKMNSLEDELTQEPKKLRDAFGMTPFHIWALSNKPSLDALTFLTQKGLPIQITTEIDAWGCSAIDYLVQRASIMENIWPVLQIILRSILQALLSQFVLKQWQQCIHNKIESLASREANVLEIVADIFQTVQEYQRIEATSLLEQFLWRAALDDNPSTKKRKLANYATIKSDSYRVACRIRCGAEVVIPNVLSFLDTEKQDTS